MRTKQDGKSEERGEPIAERFLHWPTTSIASTTTNRWLFTLSFTLDAALAFAICRAFNSTLPFRTNDAKCGGIAQRACVA